MSSLLKKGKIDPGLVIGKNEKERCVFQKPTEGKEQWTVREEGRRGRYPKHLKMCVAGWFNLSLCDRAWEEELLTCHFAFLTSCFTTRLVFPFLSFRDFSSLCLCPSWAPVWFLGREGVHAACSHPSTFCTDCSGAAWALGCSQGSGSTTSCIILSQTVLSGSQDLVTGNAPNCEFAK